MKFLSALLLVSYSTLNGSFWVAPGQTGLNLNINVGWRFQAGLADSAASSEDYDDSRWEPVSIPHSFENFSANLEGFRAQGREIGWYRRELTIRPEWAKKRLFLEFQGAMQSTTLWVNGKQAGAYGVSGFDSFDFDITALVHSGKNLICVRIDNTLNANVPPDGVKHDYILFGGLYRDVILHVTDPVHLTFPWDAPRAGVRLSLSAVSAEKSILHAEATVKNETQTDQKCELLTEVLDQKGKISAHMKSEAMIPGGTAFTFVQNSESIVNPHLWSPDDPYLYRVRTKVLRGGGEVDSITTPYGIRWVKFDKEQGFFLNGKHVKLVGANRHQTWPFIGNAVPNGLQRRDAEQLKAMGVNWIRLSHYPQDPDFLDALDELGIMATEEPPTWMDKASDAWMDNLEKSFRSMIRRDRNHPCIILWCTCINHHGAEPSLVKAAIEEDPTRDRGQDTVPLEMDFTRLKISGNGALTVEHTGHTFPAQRGARAMTFRPLGSPPGVVEADVNREYQQAQRHWEQVNAAYLKADNAGLAVWCMYDYNTEHNINEPGMVWHGVCDLFRIPKYSYFWHQSELTTKPMAYIVRIDPTHAAVFSNCERVRLSSNEGQGYHEIGTQKPDVFFIAPDGEPVNYVLHHPPFHFNVPATAMALKAEGLHGSSVSAIYEWKQFGPAVALTLEADRSEITADGADLSRLIVTAVDTNGTPVDTCRSPVQFQIEGYGELIGENPVRLRAGKMIILAQSGYVPGELTVTATSEGLAPARVKVRMAPVPPDYDIPPDLTVKQPTIRTLVPEPRRQNASR